MRDRIEDGSVREERRLAASDVWLRPDIIAEYMQLLFNAFLLTLVLTLVVKFMVMVREDVRFKLHEDELRKLRLIEACRKSYEQNECSPESRVPALEESCDEWFYCMNQAQHVHAGGRRIYQSGTLWARTIAEILNSFVEPISIRSALLTVSVICALVLVTNSAFGSYRVYHYNRSSR
ncbi:hypothetical protein HG536_0D06010 [Torulaspora globosa]|uniref:Brl1/Brr6 domain-containing protein n=1 Tax=Torulaspora globosa TaxID=48254 RepID=A0A7G3ZHU3_9SACH|nr:uncharacterized protein HG536_0D06010 [Torulaspora globosa]QLL33079.1 hypothetical protein HG536_0D06010 [Torulaspora globosa]